MPDLKGLDKDSRLLSGITPVTTPPSGISNPALCAQCNASLHVDDSFLKPALKTSATGEPYLLDTGTPSGIDVYGGIDYVRHDHIPTLPDLSLAAESGCVFCTALRDGLRNKYGASPWWKAHSEPLTLHIDYCWILGVESISLDSILVTVVHPELEESQFLHWNSETTLRFLAYAARDEDPCTKWLRLRKRLGDLPWSPDNISLSQTWITECVGRTGLCGDKKVEACDPASSSDDDSEAWESGTDGSDCNIDANSVACQDDTQIGRTREHIDCSFAPTRLLDLFPLSAHTPGCISLVESTHLGKGVRYAALSYCWGGVKPRVLTTRANLDSHKQSIKLSALPHCLRDAVIVARSLEIRYLWIDALCIIQDDSDDWARESSTMWQLFHNAYITIAAAASESFDEGFIAPRPSETFDIDFRSALNPRAVGKITLCTSPSLRRDRWDVPLELELSHCKWDTRGWVWQEQRLARRLLIFGKQMMHFKCDHCIRSEDGSNERVGADPPSQGHRGAWTRWVADYTPKSLTFQQDKLPAISGLSKQINQNSIARGGGPAEYLAGIWYCSKRRRRRESPSWQPQLFWRVSTPCRSWNQMLERFKCAEPRSYTAPSWSWASRTGGVKWHTGSKYPGQRPDTGASSPLFEAEMEEHHMNLTGPDPTGRVGPGSYLKLSGLMHRDPLDLSDLECGSRRQGGFFWWWNKSRLEGGQCLDISLDWEPLATHQEANLFDCEVRLFALWASQDIARVHGGNHVHGLLLFRDKVSGLYYRVGIYGSKYIGDYSSPRSRDQSQLQDMERWDRLSVCIA